LSESGFTHLAKERKKERKKKTNKQERSKPHLDLVFSHGQLEKRASKKKKQASKKRMKVFFFGPMTQLNKVIFLLFLGIHFPPLLPSPDLSSSSPISLDHSVSLSHLSLCT